MLKVSKLTKQYDQTIAVDDLSFEVQDGEIAVLLGPNGAGKSTTIKCITGLLRYHGNIEVCGAPNSSIQAKKLFSYVPETPTLYDLLTVYEHLEFIAFAYEVSDYREKAAKLMERFELLDKRDKLGKELSKGMQQKVSICCALLTNPKVVLFDEPMIGLDPKAIKELKKVFLDLKANGCSVLISTHIIDSITEIWDKTLIMKNGRIMTSLSRQELDHSTESLEELFFKVTGD
jgi:ABC-2 type transport system ATP-binding protein